MAAHKVTFVFLLTAASPFLIGSWNVAHSGNLPNMESSEYRIEESLLFTPPAQNVNESRLISEHKDPPYCKEQLYNIMVFSLLIVEYSI